MKIVIIGASGLLGSYLAPRLLASENEIFSIGRARSNDFICDASNSEELIKVLSKIQPNIILNLAALTDVDYCEKNPDHAFTVNTKIVENIVTWIESSSQECHLIQISTDQVYDSKGPHFENNISLTNYYAFSKYAGELIASRVSSTILRTNFFGKSECYGKISFTDWLHKSFLGKENFFLFDDVFFSPLSMESLYEIILSLFTLQPQGIYNLGSRDGLSKSSFAHLFAARLNIDISHAEILSIDDVDFLSAYRPKDMRMNVSKIEDSLNLTLPSLKNEIYKAIGEKYENT